MRILTSKVEFRSKYNILSMQIVHAITKYIQGGISVWIIPQLIKKEVEKEAILFAVGLKRRHFWAIRAIASYTP